MPSYPLIVVGAGPAGGAAAVEAARLGVPVLVVDELPTPGGQLYRPLGRAFRPRHREASRVRRFRASLEAVADRVTFWGSATVCHLSPDRSLWIYRDGRILECRAEALIIATGAYDRSVPLPGWTLPGVMAAGGAQALLKAHGTLPGRRVLLSGVGPLEYALASHLVRAGAEVVALLDANPRAAMLRVLMRGWQHPPILADGLRSLLILRRAGVPILPQHVVTRIEGPEGVEGAGIAPVDDQWRPSGVDGPTVQVDSVVLGFGFVPASELGLLAGLEHTFDPTLGGWVPCRTERFEGTVPGIFVVGDGAGVRGGEQATLEGQIAGLAAAERLGNLFPGEARRLQRRPQRRLRALRPFTSALGELMAPRGGLATLMTPDTILCRCEEIPVSEVHAAVRLGGWDLNGVKRLTRIWMGLCQGRICGPPTLLLLGTLLGRKPEQCGPLTPRPPIRPLSLSALAAEAGREYRR